MASRNESEQNGLEGVVERNMLNLRRSRRRAPAGHMVFHRRSHRRHLTIEAVNTRVGRLVDALPAATFVTTLLGDDDFYSPR